MFTFLRSRLRFAGRIGWVDGRRGYPGDEQYVELELHRPAAAAPGFEHPLERTGSDEAELPAAAVLPMSAAQRS